MSDNILNDLHDLVLTTCDSLYANRQLITKKVVKKIVSAVGGWSDDELEVQLPRFINEWRLRNLAEDNELQRIDIISQLEAQLCKYRADLQVANNIILKLKTDLINEKDSVKRLRTVIIQELRNMLRTQI
jgi:hypothetical protein